MARPSPKFIAATEPYVCVRVTDLRGVDLNTFSFDFDLTFAVLLMHPDGTVYHRYGGHQGVDPAARLSMPALLRLIRLGLDTDRAYRRAPCPPARPTRTLDDIPTWRTGSRRTKVQGCYHCHFVFEAEREQQVADGRWDPSQLWRWPPPCRIGLRLKRDTPDHVLRVDPGSQAAAADFRPGDRLLTLGSQPILSHADVSWVLETAPATATTIAAVVDRGGARLRLRLRLKRGWKAGTPSDYAWRPSKWQLKPRPGFGGRALSITEKRARGLDEGSLALEVGYLTLWDDDPRPMAMARSFAGSRPYGLAAQRAGLQKGDVIFSAARAQFSSEDELHAWWRLTRSPGQRVALGVLRGTTRRTLWVDIP